MNRTEIIITCLVFSALLTLAIFDLVLSKFLAGFIHLSLAAAVGKQFIAAVEKATVIE